MSRSFFFFFHAAPLLIPYGSRAGSGDGEQKDSKPPEGIEPFSPFFSCPVNPIPFIKCSSFSWHPSPPHVKRFEWSPPFPLFENISPNKIKVGELSLIFFFPPFKLYSSSASSFPPLLLITHPWFEFLDWSLKRLVLLFPGGGRLFSPLLL